MDGREEKKHDEESLSFHKEEEDDGSSTCVNVATDSSDDEDEEEEFEFSFVRQFHDQTDEDLADNLFGDGQIRPVYPVFDRNLLREEFVDQELSSFKKITIDDGNSSSSGREEWRPDPESYCEWNPKMGSPPLNLRKKSRSTGESSSRRWRLRDLVVGRSHSDGKHKFFFLAPEKNKEKGNEKEKVVVVEKRKDEEEKKVKGTATETRMTRAYRLYYAKDGTGGDRKLTHLTYRRNLFG